jgi:26S proteasome regulatory subunit T5
MSKKWTEKEVVDTFGSDISESSTQEIEQRCRLIDNEIRVYRNEKSRIAHDEATMKERIKENKEKIKLNKQLPYLVANVVEVPFSFLKN